MAVLNGVDQRRIPRAAPRPLEGHARGADEHRAAPTAVRRSGVPEATDREVHAQVVLAERLQVLQLALLQVARLVHPHAVRGRRPLVHRSWRALVPIAGVLVAENQEVEQLLPAHPDEAHENPRPVAQNRRERETPWRKALAVAFRREPKPASGEADQQTLHELDARVVEMPLLGQDPRLVVQVVAHRRREQGLVDQHHVVLHVLSHGGQQGGPVQEIRVLPRRRPQALPVPSARGPPIVAPGQLVDHRRARGHVEGDGRLEDVVGHGPQGAGVAVHVCQDIAPLLGVLQKQARVLVGLRQMLVHDLLELLGHEVDDLAMRLPDARPHVRPAEPERHLAEPLARGDVDAVLLVPLLVGPVVRAPVGILFVGDALDALAGLKIVREATVDQEKHLPRLLALDEQLVLGVQRELVHRVLLDERVHRQLGRAADRVGAEEGVDGEDRDEHLRAELEGHGLGHLLQEVHLGLEDVPVPRLGGLPQEHPDPVPQRPRHFVAAQEIAELVLLLPLHLQQHLEPRHARDHAADQERHHHQRDHGHDRREHPLPRRLGVQVRGAETELRQRPVQGGGVPPAEGVHGREPPLPGVRVHRVPATSDHVLQEQDEDDDLGHAEHREDHVGAHALDEALEDALHLADLQQAGEADEAQEPGRRRRLHGAVFIVEEYEVDPFYGQQNDVLREPGLDVVQGHEAHTHLQVALAGDEALQERHRDVGGPEDHREYLHEGGEEALARPHVRHQDRDRQEVERQQEDLHQVPSHA
mmetsp:Transcript_31899/g.96449  ORF Transcript_31899/g.96449 Transcript_31899/m.96449 type:complete len:758 (+) Transcript_31899:263-2536(+)